MRSMGVPTSAGTTQKRSASSRETSASARNSKCWAQMASPLRANTLSTSARKTQKDKTLDRPEDWRLYAQLELAEVDACKLPSATASQQQIRRRGGNSQLQKTVCQHEGSPRRSTCCQGYLLSIHESASEDWHLIQGLEARQVA